MQPEATVRPVQAADLPLVLAWRNHPDIRRHMLTRHEITLEEHLRWFEAASRDASRRLLIVETGATPLGYVQFSDVGPGAVSQWGFYAAPEAPAGSGTRLGRAALAFGFGQLELHKVCGQALAENLASIRFHHKMGFRQEGILRQQQRIAGSYHDLVCFGLLRDEWQPVPDQPKP